jgi:hypothetical protein
LRGVDECVRNLDCRVIFCLGSVQINTTDNSTSLFYSKFHDLADAVYLVILKPLNQPKDMHHRPQKPSDMK